jgi:excisionase family DNA binding protein
MARRSPSVHITPAEIAQPPAMLHDIATAAKIMSTTPWAIRQLCRAKKLPFVRIGHRWLISTDAIRSFIAKAEVTA